MVLGWGKEGLLDGVGRRWLSDVVGNEGPSDAAKNIKNMIPCSLSWLVCCLFAFFLGFVISLVPRLEMCRHETLGKLRDIDCKEQLAGPVMTIPLRSPMLNPMTRV